MDKELKQMFLERRCADDQPVYAKKISILLMISEM